MFKIQELSKSSYYQSRNQLFSSEQLWARADCTVNTMRARFTLYRKLTSFKYKPHNIKEMPPNFKDPTESEEKNI